MTGQGRFLEMWGGTGRGNLEKSKLCCEVVMQKNRDEE